ncbi:MAG TPA: radical SAM protein [Pyrinomonadaceae bacterium]|nr:radical SAM protein [Pyrinomonadaceae bacterium]
MSKRLSICLINPRSKPSYWTADFAMPFYQLGRKLKYSMANGSLVSIAALVPSGHEIVIIDENVESIDFTSLSRFDVIGVTGMVVQGERMLEILRRLQTLPAVVVAGGPLVTVNENIFEGLCDVRFIGEAEQTWPAFLNALASEAPFQSRYEQGEKTDMSQVPVPRFDLLKRGCYGTAPVQFSRGCPFLCEFCDIITIFGRRPRVKSPEQVLRELDAVLAQGFKGCFLVDDNFIGNKVEAKRLLRRIIEWQQTHRFPLTFVTEASINLANDQELIDLMVEANFQNVFIGIETPREASLTETRKHQNVHGDSLLAKLARIRARGLKVSAGFIVGFDNDDQHIFDEQYEFIQSSGIANLSISLLTPLPTTPLYERLRAENRLDFSDPELIYHPKQMTRAELKAGFRQLLDRVFEVEAYFHRVYNPPHDPSARVRLGVKCATQIEQPKLKIRLLHSAAWSARAIKLAFVMARKRQLLRHLRVVPRIVRTNASLGNDAFGFGEMMDHWISYWHFASVTRQISGTEFGNVTKRSKHIQPTVSL